MGDYTTEINDLKDSVFNLLKDESKDLWSEEDTEFLKSLSEQIATETILMSMGDKPEEHKQNLRHLAATIQGEMVRKQIKLNKKGREVFERIITIVIKTIISVVVKAIKI